MSTATNARPAEGTASGEIDQMIVQVEKLYQAVTGEEAPRSNGAYAAIPPEKDPARHVDEQIDRLLSLLAAPRAAGPTVAWVPPLSVWENEKEIVLWLDVPGVSRDALEVRLDGNVVTVLGERPAASRGESRLGWSERPLGRFRRMVSVPGGVEGDPSAELKDGVLEIRVRREARTERVSKQVPVS